jgi:hypothetical protein
MRLSCFDAGHSRFGDVLFVLAGTIHSVKNIVSGNGAELSKCVVEKPLMTLV